MGIIKKLVHYLSQGIAISLLSLLLATICSAETKFYLFPGDTDRSLNCDFVTIKNSRLTCTDNTFLVTYELTQIKALKILQEKNAYLIKGFNQETIKKINAISASKAQKKQIATQSNKDSTWSTVDSYEKIPQALQTEYQKLTNKSTLNLIVLGFGLVIFLVGSVLFLVTAFRVGLAWGLGCLLLPLISLIFLFAHRRVATKPFLISMLGLAIAFAGASLGPTGATTQQFTDQQVKTPHTTTKKPKDKMYTCRGKIYCSEMTSCEEAFYYSKYVPYPFQRS